MTVELVIILLCLLLSILIANHRLKVLRRLALVAGIIYTLYGLVLLLVPQVIIAFVKDAQATAGVEIAKFVINPLTYFSLITGVVLLVAVIVSAIIGKALAGPKANSEPPSKDTTEHQQSDKPQSHQHNQKAK